MNFSSVHIDDLDEAALHRLIVEEVREHVQLDYKREYPAGQDWRINLLTDVTAMANAQGGYILIGIEEDSAKEDGTPGQIAGVADGDQLAQRIEGLCQSSIEEKIAGLRVRAIPLSNGQACVAISIPNSPRKPHMVVSKSYRGFALRHDRTNTHMGIQEVKEMILNMSAYRSALSNFLQTRKVALETAAKSQPWVLVMATPIYVDSDKINPLAQNIREAVIETVVDTPLKWVRTFHPRPRWHGLGCEETERQSDGYLQALRLFRNGHLECCANLTRFIQKMRSDDQEPLPISAELTTTRLLATLKVAARIAQLGEINEPWQITLHWVNTRPAYLHREVADRGFETIVWQEEPALTIEVQVDDLADPLGVTRQVTDRLYNTFGYEGNIDFERHTKNL